MRLLAFIAILISIQFSASAQTTWYVPDDFTTIQGAISDTSVVNGDFVIVRPDTYMENIDFLGKAITVKSEMGPSVTTIDGGNPVNPGFGSPVVFNNDESSDSVLDGFELTNGTGTRYEGYPNIWYYGGGGILCHKSSPTITNNIISMNWCDQYGGGILCDDASPTITNNTITNNCSTLYGGGIFCKNDSSPVIENNTITKNSTSFSGGAGIGCHYSNVTITNNIITENSAAHLGGGVYCDGSSSTITNNTIIKNSAESGGGLYCFNTANMVIKDNTITENHADLDGGGIYCVDLSASITNNIIAKNYAGHDGGGISLGRSPANITNLTMYNNLAAYSGGGISCQYSSPVITNSILWNNSALIGPEIFIDGSSIHPSHLKINHSDVKNGMASVTLGLYSFITWGTGMIDANPLFVDAGKGDSHLTFPSPCRNAGDNSAVTELYDFEGDPRIAYNSVDMGADEFHPHLYLTGDATPAGAIKAKFVGLPGTLINGVILGVNIFDPPLPCDYGLWYMDNPFQIITGLGSIPLTGIAVFPGTIPAVPPTPYTFYLQGVIDMELTNLCPVAIE